MIIAAKLLLCLVLVLIFIQDLRERQVYTIFMISAGALMSFMHYSATTPYSFYSSILLNLFVIMLVILCLHLYAKHKLNKSLNQTIGTGDFLFFVVLALGFSSATFLLFFTFSLIFSLLASVFMQYRHKDKTVPLAGLQSLFVALSLIFIWFFDLNYLYFV